MIFDRLYKFFTSLKLTVTLLGLGLVLVFLGTLAQEPLGLYAAQERYFRSFFVDNNSFYAGIYKLADMISQGFGHPMLPLDGNRMLTAPRFPVFPGGYLVGVLLLINLIAAHTRYYQPGRKKIGIMLIHGGIVLLLTGQLLTDVLSTESTMHIRNGGTKNYSESGSACELAIVDTSDPASDKVVAISGRRLAHHGDVTHPELPFTLRVKTYFNNSSLTNAAANGYEPVPTTAGVGDGIWWREWPRETEMNKRDLPSAIVELVAPGGSLGTWLVSAFLTRPQRFTYEGRSYEMDLRPTRYYKPFSLHLVEFRHDRYPGTEIPKNYSSRVRLHRPETGEEREVLIYMNNPLRYWGETYYQASFDPDDQGTVLQVVRNPGWLTPYLACVLVAGGLAWQFLSHLLAFAGKRKLV
jgi:ResB-like family protein